MLYTREFFEIVKSHLNPGGVVTLFVQLYESNTAAVKSEIATFMEAFPNGVIWGNTQDGRGYDLVLMGTVEPLQINVDEIQAKLSRPEYAPVAKSLSEVGIYSAIDLFANYAGRGSDMGAWTARCAHQPRSQSQAAIPRGPGPQPLSERSDLFRDARPRKVSRRPLHRQRRHAARRFATPSPAPRDEGWRRNSSGRSRVALRRGLA